MNFSDHVILKARMKTKTSLQVRPCVLVKPVSF
jgi:hypothetical protein